MTSPRKVPLPYGDDSRSSDSSGNVVTKRVFFCGVVVEGTENGRRLPDDVQDLVLSLGGPLETNFNPSSSSRPSELRRTEPRMRENTDISALQTRINELVSTERTYVRRIQTLKRSYADPLRQFAKDKHTSLLPKYDAKIIFGNIDALVPVNEAFLTDLEKLLSPSGPQLVGGIGDVALKHFKDFKGFEQYKQFYVNREEAQRIFVREMSRKSSPFRDYIERAKCEACDDSGNRVGLRELLIEPVQRIPRYTMLFRMMIDSMALHDPQREKLSEADQLASKIALADPGEETKRALIFRCFTSTIEGFPADLCSSSRRFIDCVDVEDIISESSANGSSSSSSISGSIMHCTLLLFDDKLVFVKRPNGEKSGRSLTGLDDMEKFSKGGVFPPAKKKSGMTYRGMVDVTDVAAVDVEGSDIHLFLENPPRDQGDRWSGRPFRSLSVVKPPMPVNLDPTATEAEKQRFLEHLWQIQAIYRSNSGLSVVRCTKEMEVDSRPGKTVLARTYFNIYQRTAFLQEPKKTKVVVHVNSNGADRIPFGAGGPPYAVIQVIPMAGDLSRYKVTSSDEADEDEDDIVQTARVPSRIVQTIHQFGFFDFKTGPSSRPSTPTSKNKSAIFGLDVISRRLNGRPGSTMGDFFGGSVNSHRRNKSAASRSSVYTHTSVGDGSLMRFSHRSNSTAATSITTMDEDPPMVAKSTSSRNVLRRAKSPGPISERGSPLRNQSTSRASSRTRSRSNSVEKKLAYDDNDTDSGFTCLTEVPNVNGSEWDLNMKLELARRNSHNQDMHPVSRSIAMNPSVEPMICEEDERVPKRSLSVMQGETDIRPAPTACPTSPLLSARPCSPERRPGGPRSPSPQPLAIHPVPLNPHHRSSRPPSFLPRSKRVPLFPTGNTETPAKPPPSTNPTIEPLTIKKKIPSPHKELPTHLVRHVTNTSIKSLAHPVEHPGDDRCAAVLHLAVTTKEDIESVHRSVKRLKLEIEKGEGPPVVERFPSRSPSPDKMFRTAASHVPLSREAHDRMNEMRNLIGRRAEPSVPIPPEKPSADHIRSRPLSSHPNEHLLSAERGVATAEKNHRRLVGEIEQLTSCVTERYVEHEKTKTELSNSKRQCELLKNLLTDATAEKDIMYEAFNEELDGMFNDVNLPDDEAWENLTKDLRRTKEARNTAAKDNSELKRKLREMELQTEQWGALLRSHGLIP